MKKGLFIVLEGCEGVGKSLQATLITEYLKERGLDVIKTREPGGTPIAEKIRDIIVNEDVDGVTEALLFASARREHITKKIKPALNEGKVVICDRFVYSSIAYQGKGRGLGIDFVESLNKPAIDNCYPDVVLYLDLAPEIGLKRISNNNRETNRLDCEKIEFYNSVREGFLEIAKREPEKFVSIDANQKPDEVFNDIKKVLDSMLKQNF